MHVEAYSPIFIHICKYCIKNPIKYIEQNMCEDISTFMTSNNLNHVSSDKQEVRSFIINKITLFLIRVRSPPHTEIISLLLNNSAFLEVHLVIKESNY